MKCDGFTLRRPISICDAEGDILRLVVDRRGGGTEWLCARKPGDALDILGPLGRGFTPQSGPLLLVGGGIGTPPLLYAAKAHGTEARAILGFRSAEAVMLEADFRALCADVCVTTDDGSYGRRGFVDAAAKEAIAVERPAAVFACGPEAMLKALQRLCREEDIPLYLSLEERMGCGVGACLVCACKTRREGKEHYSHVCKDGPVFSGEEVCFE
ncbi:dihydroorotate dehydrogenase electron transfer subunit [Oscillospiraceae bacterium OttesenSCG-928-F05]|nr:dihydroorotate dehydrogenase electron transfer subunit [Oscillospiraceae bacterium OttesenSCG-928-F05]